MIFSIKHVFSAHKKFDLSFFEMCYPRHMCSVIIHDRKIFCGRFGPVQPFHLLVPVKVRILAEFLIFTSHKFKQIIYQYNKLKLGILYNIINFTLHLHIYHALSTMTNYDYKNIKL